MVSSLCSSRQLGGRFSLSEVSPSLAVDWLTPWPPTAPPGPPPPPARAPRRPSRVGIALRRRGPGRRAPRAARGAGERAREGGAGRARAARRAGAGERPGHVWRRRGGLGARGFKKVWSGAGAFPGLAEGRRAEAAAAAAAHGGGGRRALGARIPGPALPRPKETLRAAVSLGTLRRGSASEPALLPSAALSPSLRVAPPSRRLPN